MDLSGGRYFQTEGIRVISVEETASTNTDLMRLAEAGEKEGLLLVANRQTGGRGRLGRSFFSPAGTGLYMSMLLRPGIPADRVTLLTPMAAVAVSEALEEICAVTTGIKWVNDVLLNGKKICGILTEASFKDQPRPEAVVVGIGLNLTAPPGGFPEELRQIAGAVYGDTLPDDTVVPRLMAGIWDRFFAYCRHMDANAFLKAYRERMVLTGKTVTFVRNGETAEATVIGVDDRCGLRVCLARGGEETLISGEVSVRPL